MSEMPEDIVAVIEAYGNARYTQGYFYDGDEDTRPSTARSALDALILRHLSDALARAERVEKALDDLLAGIVIEGRNSDDDYPTEPGAEWRLLEEPHAEEIAEYFRVKPVHTLLDLCKRIVAGRSALTHPEPVEGEPRT